MVYPMKTEEKQSEKKELSLDDFLQDPENVIPQLYDVEKATVAILCLDSNPLVVNWIRGNFIEKIFDNLSAHLTLYGMNALIYEDMERKRAIDALKKRFIAHQDDVPSKKAAFLQELSKEIGKKVKIKRDPSQVSLIPSFDYFVKIVGELERYGIITHRDSEYKHAERAYSPIGPFRTKWKAQREALLKKEAQENLSIAPAEALFYGLTPTMIRRYEEVLQNTKTKTLEEIGYEIPKFPLTRAESDLLDAVIDSLDL